MLNPVRTGFTFEIGSMDLVRPVPFLINNSPA